jgi:hypothetical protein
MASMPELRKHCGACGEEKGLDAFTRNAARFDGYDSSCKVCRLAYQRAWRLVNQEEWNERARRYYDRNRERLRAYFREYHRRRTALKRTGEWKPRERPDRSIAGTSGSSAAEIDTR